MSNALYDAAREGFIDGSIDWDTDTIKVGLVPSTYVFSATHRFVSDLAVTLNGRSGALTGRTATNGTANAADTSLVATAQISCKALVLFKDTGSDASSRLICYIDTATGLPFTPNASQTIPITWDNNVNAIFQWVASTAPTTPLPDDIVDSSGNIVNSSYDSMYAAGVAETDAYFDYRLGKAPSSTAGGVVLFERTHTKYPDNYPSGQANCVYEFGGPPPVDDGGFYSTNQADVATVQASTGSGIIALQTSAYTNNTGQVKPQPQWQVGYQTNHSNVPGYITAGFISAGDVKPAFIMSAADVHADNGPSRLICTAGGSTGPKLLGVGSNTARNSVTLQLAANKLASCGTMTVMGEFVFVCLWDAAARKGQVAVIIAAGQADGVAWTTPGLSYDWWHDWLECYPGLPNRGNTNFLKLLGYVDIPGMAAPTSCHVTTGYHPWQIIGGDGEGIGSAMSPIQSHYTEVRDGGVYGGKVARGGLLAVASKSEKKVVFFDLKNLFEWVYDSYLGTNHTRGERVNLGMGDSQWPQVMSVSGVTMPAVKTLTFASQVNALRFTATRPAPQVGGLPPYLWAMTGDGTCHTIQVGTNYVPGVATGRSGSPSEISVKSTTSGFGSVSQIAQMMGMNQTGNVDNNTGFWFVCRPTREIGYAKMNSDGTGGTIPLKYVPHSTQCADPAGIFDIDNYSNATNSQIVLDYNGRKLCGFRTDILHHNGSWTAWPQNTPVQPTAGVPVEYNGFMATSGKPIHGISANVP